MDRKKITLAAKELQLEKSGILGAVSFHGNSMLPFLVDGDELISVPVSWNEIKAGDIVTYRLEDKFPTCRVIEKRLDKLVVKADHWPELIEVDPEDVLGKVVERHRGVEILKAGDPSWILYSENILWKLRKEKLRSRIRYYKKVIREVFKKG